MGDKRKDETGEEEVGKKKEEKRRREDHEADKDLLVSSH